MEDDAAKPASILVVGSINMDIVTRVERLPKPGETTIAKSIDFIPGGKGANQSVAASRLGARVNHVGAVGNDEHGQRLLMALQDEGVQTGSVKIASTSSGLAYINVDDQGENTITIVPGANATVEPESLVDVGKLLENADVVLLQLELPIATVLEVIRQAKIHSIPVIVDPAPAQHLPETAFDVSVFTPNQTETEFLLKESCRTAGDAAQCADALHDLGAQNVVIKMGSQGAFVSTAGFRELVPAPHVSTVDSTAAGDAFTAALATFLAEDFDWPQAVQLACKAGALATTKLGAQPAMPARDEVLRKV